MGKSRLLLLVLALALFVGCAPPAPTFIGQSADLRRASDHPSRLNCFLTLRDREGPAIRLEVAALEVLADDYWLPVAEGPLLLDSSAIGAGQLFLGGRAVPPGSYRRLRLTVTRGTTRQADGTYSVIAPEPFRLEVDFPAPLLLERDDSRTLLISWDVKNSLGPGNALLPVMTVAEQVRQMLTDLTYVACPDIDTVFVVRADLNWVVDSFGLRGRPTYLALDPAPLRQRLFILASHEAVVKVVDLSSLRLVDLFPVPLNDVPTFMTISPDGRSAYLLDERSGYLSRMDLGTGRSVSRVRLGYRPNYAAYLAGQNLLAVSLSLSQTVVLLDPLSLATVATIATGSSPQGMLEVNGQLFIAESGEHMVSIVDLLSLRNLGRVAVGAVPRRLVEAGNQIFVGNFDNGTLSVLVPGQLGVIREIHDLGRPLEMAFNQVYRKLYVADEEAAALAVVDVNSNLLIGRIVLGARPSGLAVIQ